MKIYEGSAREFARVSAAEQLAIISEKMRQAGNFDEESLHDLRVALRRLRNAFELFGNAYLHPKKGAALARSIAKSVQRLRDQDVQLELFSSIHGEFPSSTLCACIISELSRERELERNLVKWAIDNRWANMLGRLSHCAGLSLSSNDSIFDIARPFLANKIAEVAHRLPLAEREPFSRAQHELRIATKHLRYTLELLRARGGIGSDIDGFIGSAKKVQDSLGKIHDIDVSLQILYEKGHSYAYMGELAELLGARRHAFFVEFSVSEFERGINALSLENSPSRAEVR